MKTDTSNKIRSFLHKVPPSHETYCVMKLHSFFLLIYLGTFCVGSAAFRNTTCARRDMCDPEPDATSHFLQCAGLPPTDTGRDHMHRLKRILEGTMDIYTFMKSSLNGVPLLSLEGELELNGRADPLQNEALVQMWLEIKMKPLLKSITKHFLSCLSTKNFSCSTYQTVVKEFSQHYSEMNPAQQKWIYTFFMYPFLSGDGIYGCADTEESSEEWLMKNFGAFRAMARMKDFSALNMVFSGVEVLHLLSPAQKAELLMRPEVERFENGTLSLIFHSLLTGGSDSTPTARPGGDQSWTTPAESSTLPSYPTQPAHQSHHLSPREKLRKILNGVMTAVKPIGSFVHDFMSFTRQRNVSDLRSTTMTQFLLNWTLAELADMYHPKDKVPKEPQFDVTNVGDWYQQVVIPLLQRFITNNEILEHQSIKLAFHQLFYLDNPAGNEFSENPEIEDVCSITLDKTHCGLTDAVENVAHVLHCAARTNLTLNEETIMRLILELTKRLNLLIKELFNTNFKEVSSEIKEIFGEGEAPSLTQEHLNDPNFIQLWFQIKLLPLLPDVHPDLLSCLSTKNFSCPVYQSLVSALGESMSFMDADPIYSQNIYKYFIYSFLQQHNFSDSHCSANNSAEWLEKNVGFFSKFASIIDFYELNPNFSGLEVLHLLTPNQTAEMLLLPLRTPPEKDVVINYVLNYLIESPEDRKFLEVMYFVIQLAQKINPPCSIYTLLADQLYNVIPSLSPDLEPVVWALINDLINIVPEDCKTKDMMCPQTHVNGTDICKDIDSSDLEFYISMSTNVPCNFTLEKYACAQLENFAANQLASLLRCDLPRNSSRSRVLWKLLLTKLSNVLDPALDLLAGMSMVSPSAPEILDVIGEMRLFLLANEQLMDSNVIKLWFSERLSGFLPSASKMFLLCLSSRNLSCQSYHQIVQVFSRQFKDMTFQQQQTVLRDFILRFLSEPHTGPGCVSASNSSAQWLSDNLGSFSELLSVSKMFDLNPQFNPIEALSVLSPKQSAELLVLKYPTLPNTDVIINKLFDYFTESPRERKFTEFLSFLVVFLEMGTLSCTSYKTLFTQLDYIEATASLDVASFIPSVRANLSKNIQPGCAIFSGECNVVTANESNVCVGVNSTELQLQLNSGKMGGRFCDFSVEEFACASLSALTAQDLAEILKCNRSSSSSGSTQVWKLLLNKASGVLDAALDLLTNSTISPMNPSASMILDSIQEIKLDQFSNDTLNDPLTLQLWFNNRLCPFLPAVSNDFLSCLSTKDLQCSSYQYIVQILSQVQPQMALPRQISVYTNFIKIYLKRNNTADPGCIFNINSSSEWLQNNVGGFSVLLSIQNFQELYPQFSAMEALAFLSIRQLAEVFVTNGQITTIDQVTMVMSYVPDQQLGSFFDNFSPAILGRENILPSTVRSAMLQVVFDRANLSSQSVSDAVVSLWLQVRLRPLLVNLAPYHVAPYFQILSGRNCSIEQQGVNLLNQTISSLSNDTQTEIQSRIIQALQGPSPLRCYGDNYSYSFYSFLRSSFLGFQFPNLTTFLSLIPPDRNQQLINSMPPSDLGDFLRHTNVVGQESQLCQLYSSYLQIPVFLETESLPEQVRQRTLPCVWPIALRSSSRSEVNAWFDRGLPNYLVSLTKTQINQITSINASCLAFQKIVSALGSYNYSVADFTNQDVYNTIKVYLSSATSPKCYDSNNPELNSTAWFAEYIGSFITFLTLVDLQSFGSQQDLQLFTVNPQNLLLLNQYKVDVTIVIYYIHLVYQQDINFSPLGLPSLGQCFAPGRVFTQLTSQESLTVLGNVNRVCTDLDPQIAAALASNFGENIDAKVISALGNESTSLSISQIKSLKPSDLVDSLNILSNVIGWRIGQAKAIVLSLLTSGSVQINSSASLLNLGSLIPGVPSTVFSSISGSDLVTVSRNPSVLFYILSAPQIVQLTFVIQIIYLNTNSLQIIENVPDNLATEIPGVYLLQFPNDSSTVIKLNRKKWKPQQVALFFDIIAANSETAELGGPNNLSSSVLQGFTCTTIRSLGKRQIKNLIKACRRKGTNKVPLVETQLTCMYNQIKDESDATSFSLYPPDVLLYYDYSLVPQSSCRSYFQELADADFSIFSPALTYKRSALFDNARSCLGITSTSLSEDNVSVLGNMCCILDGSYIQNSHPSILEQLKNCPDLTVGQSAAVETLLTNGNTPYGLSSTWNEQTLKDLGMLTLHLPSSFYQRFDQDTKRNFLKYFLKVFGTVSREQRKQLKKEIRQSIKSDSEQTAECTVGIITQVTISDPTFPFDYNINQFNNCLSVSTVKDNLDAITEKVDEVEYLRIVLQKLQEADNSIIPEDQIQLLSAASRVATVQDIRSWTISKIDTLAALMDSSNGGWDPSIAKVIISKYLAVGGNKLGSAELNVIGGPNLCSLDVDVIRTISSQSFREVDSLDISSCTADKKKEFFTISFEAFNHTTSSVSVFQLIQPYIGGANVNYIRSLVVSDVNMDLATFTSLDENVVLSLNARQVKAVLGTNLPDLKSYENQTLVQTWIRSQYQSELDILGLGIRGGKVDPPIPPYYSSTTTLVPTTTNTTEFKPSPASTTEPPTSSSASTLSPTTTNVTEFNPSPASTTEPPTSIPTSTSSPTTTNVTEFNPSPASTAEPPTSIPTSTSSPTTTNVTEFNPSPPSTAKPTTAGSTTTTSTTNIISGTTRLPTVLSSTTTSQPPSRTSTSTSTVLPTDIYTVQCQVIAANESNTCIGVNSTGLQVYLDSGKMNGRFCNFSVEEFACASLSALTAQDLVEIMTCDRSSISSGSISAWNLLFCKTSRILNAALNLLTTATINPNNPAVSVILDSIQAIRPDLFSTNTLNNLTELQLLFNVTLRPFLPAVSTNFLSILAMKDLQCSSYQYIVQVFSKVQPQMTLSKQESVYTQFIKIYLSRKNTAAPKCYDSNNPELKSTAWFAEYISSFITFLTVVDLKSFGSEQVLQVFTVNPLNIALLSQPNVDLTLISYYTQLVYQQVSNFNPLLLPSVSQCYAPGPVFTQLNATVSMTVYEALNEVCTSLDEQISATLISNFGNTIGSNVIAAIGNGSASLSTSQIKTITALELMKSLSILSIVTGWREGQAKIIMQTLLTLMKINSSSSLSQLGTLVIGLPSNTFSSIISSELIAAAKNPLFVANMLNAAQILQQSFVYQIVISNLISLNIIDNVPDQLATQIPRVYLQQFTGDDIIKLNKKTWKREQVELFFDVIAAGSATTVLGSPNSLSSSVLQGFTCTGVSQFERKQVTDLVKACRRKGLNKVPLLETQLTCMYNYIRTDPDVTKFDLYPPDVLLYYDYSLVPQSSCRSYFQELGDADFSIFSSVLSYKLTALFDNARSCLGITNTSLTEDNVSVLGNMCCMLDGSYIKSSDPSILEKLKNCPDLTAAQAAAVVTLLTNGNTQYGTPSKWNQTTLTDLGMLPLYLPTSFYDNFDKSTKVTFLKSFLKVIKDNKVSRDKRRQLKEVIRQSIKNRSKRSTDCTVGNITQVTISDSTFPLDYDVTQFNNCLSNTVVKDNFDAITEKVDEKDYLKIVLQKLGEAYNFVVPEDQVQVLGPASRVATIDDIRSWTITQVDTLSALMDSSNGDWNSSLANVIISKYLAVAGNSLGRAELNAIKGPNLCSLDLSVIQSISSQNLKEAEALNVISCTLEAKKKLFNISSQSFRAVTQSSSSYQLMKQFLGGAPLDYIRGLVSSNISMDLETFSNLDPNIVPSLTVNEVKGLLGTNLPDLKSYENQPLVQAWIRSQLQSELDTLGLNLSGGRADPVTTATLTTTAGTVTAGSGGSATTGSGVRIQADAGFSFFSFLAILITSQLITI